MAQKLGIAPNQYDPSFFNDQFGKINRMFADLQNTANPILSGNGPPPKSLGATGTFYVDLAGKMFYGPKGSNGWPTGFSLGL